MKQLLLLLFFTHSSLCFLAQDLPKYEWNDKSYFIYPQRQDASETDDVIPLMQKLPDGDYIVFAEKNYMSYKTLKDSMIVTITFSLKEGKKEGLAKWYNEKEKVISEGNFENDLKEGTWVDYYKNGKIRKKENFIEGHSYWGNTAVFYRNKQVREHYLQVDSANGITRFEKFTKKGELLQRGDYQDGSIGYHVQYNEWNPKRKNADFEKKNNSLVDGVKFYWGNKKGSLKRKIIEIDQIPDSIVYGKTNSSLDYDQQYDGDWLNHYYKYEEIIWYGELGDFLSEAGYLDYAFTGWDIEYYPDGLIKRQRLFKDGNFIYTSPEYYPNGKVRFMTISKQINDSLIHDVEYYNNSSGRPQKIVYISNRVADSIVEFTYYKKKKEIQSIFERHSYARHTFLPLAELDSFACSEKIYIDGKLKNRERFHLSTLAKEERLMPIRKGKKKPFSDSVFYSWDEQSKRLNFEYHHIVSENSRYIEKGHFDAILGNSEYEWIGPGNVYSPDEEIIIFEGKVINGPCEIRFDADIKKQKNAVNMYRENGVFHLDLEYANLWNDDNETQAFEVSKSVNWRQKYKCFKGEMINGLRSGQWSYSNLNGSYIATANYKNGKLDGELIRKGKFDPKNTRENNYPSKSDMVMYRLDQTMDVANVNKGFAVFSDYYFSKRWGRVPLAGLPRKEGILILEKENYKEGLPHGTFTEYYPEQTIKMISNFANGEMDGLFISMALNGDTIDIGNYVLGKDEGISRHFVNGKIYRVLEYENGIAQGLSERYFEDGTIKEKGLCVNGFKTGDWIEYYKSGVKFIVKTYKQTDSVYVSNFYINDEYFSVRSHAEIPINGFYENGEVMFSSTKTRRAYTNDWQFYNIEGIKINEIIFSEGFDYIQTDTTFDSIPKPWTVTTWYNDGKLKFNAEASSYHLGLDCELKINKPMVELIYKNIWGKEGEQIVKDGTGYAKLYYENEVLSAEGELVNGIENGMWYYWDENGRLNKIGNYINGLKHGKWLEGDLEGMNFVEKCFNPNALDIEELIKKEENLLDITVEVFDLGNRLSSTRFHRNNNEPDTE